MLDAILAWAASVPHIVVYPGLAVGAGLENVFPAVPADTFVLLGGIISATGDLQARWVFLATWLGNVSCALAVYWVGRTHGRVFFELGWGRHVLNDAQMERMSRFSARWGVLAVFFSRFLPGFRAMVPVFAGVSRQRLLHTAIPIGTASAIWYGALVWLGTLAGHNLDTVLGLVTNVKHALLLAAAVVAIAVGVWWWRTRHHE